MRMCSIVLCAVLLAAVPAAAQQTAAVGVKGGFNFADLNLEGDGVDVNFDRRTGAVAGLFVVWPADSRVAMQLELLFSQKGASINEEGGSGKLKIDYFDVPILLRASSARRENLAFHVFGGPSVGFRLRARATGTDGEEEVDEDLSEVIERTDVGLVVGAGIDVGRFTIDARQQWGLTNINKEENEPKIKNRVFSVMAGVRF